LVCACGGGGGGVTLAQNPGAIAPAGSSVALQISIPAPVTLGAARAPKFVSASTNGIAISDSVHGSATVAYSTSADLSSGSASCSPAAAGGRNCTVSLLAPVGSADFTITTYDVAPSSPNFGSAPHALGKASVTATIVANTTNTVNVALGGIVASISLITSQHSVYGGGAASVSLGVSALDAGTNVIVAGAADPYPNPITITLSETGGSGHASLSLNGGAAQTSVILTKSSDAVTLAYDGLGLPGYFASLAAAAQNATGASSALDPMFLTASGTGAYVGGAAPALSLTGASQTESIALQEASYSGTFGHVVSFGTSTCPVGSINVNTPSGPAGTPLSISPGTVQTSGAGCVLAVSDEITASVNVAVTFVLPPSIFVADNNQTGYIAEFNPAANGNVAPQSVLGTNGAISQPAGIAFDPSGNLYIANISSNSIAVYAKGAAGAGASPSAVIQGAATGLNGPYAVFATSTNIYVSDETLPGSVRVFPIGSNGNVTPTQVITGNLTGLGNFNLGIAADSVGHIFVAEPFNNQILIFAANANGNVSPIGSITGVTSGQGITMDSGDNLYVAQGTHISVYPRGSTGTSPPSQVIAGSNTGLSGAMFVAVDANKNIYASNNDGACGTGNCSVTVYAAGANGNLFPTAKIAGANANIGNPYGIAIQP
jgi:hypothetical protein